MELRTARRIARLTQLELAKLAGIDDSFVSMIESGKRHYEKANYGAVVRIALALNVDPVDLFPVALPSAEGDHALDEAAALTVADQDTEPVAAAKRTA